VAIVEKGDTVFLVVVRDQRDMLRVEISFGARVGEDVDGALSFS
jgi:hypothetical protein